MIRHSPGAACALPASTRRRHARRRVQILLTGRDNHEAGFGLMTEVLTPEQSGKHGYDGIRSFYTGRAIVLINIPMVLKGTSAE